MSLELLLRSVENRQRPASRRRRRTGWDLWDGAGAPRESEEDAKINTLLMHMLVDGLGIHEDGVISQIYQQGNRALYCENRERTVAWVCTACTAIALCVNLVYFYTLVHCMLPYAHSNFALWFTGVVGASTQTMIALLGSLQAARHQKDIYRLRSSMRWSSSMLFWSERAIKDLVGFSLSSSSIEAYITGLLWMTRYRDSTYSKNRGLFSFILVAIVAVSMARFVQHAYVEKCESYRNQAITAISLYHIIVPQQQQQQQQRRQ